jgi:ribosomal protein L11 methylase PrmA
VLVASGIFMDRERDVRAALRSAGLDAFERTSDGDWVALVARRISGSSGPVEYDRRRDE